MRSLSARPSLWTTCLCLVFAASSSIPALAQTKSRPTAATATPSRPAANGPKAIGRYDDWTAATHDEGGQLACYAFTRAVSSLPATPGRGDVVLTVTQRIAPRDAVAISAGFTYGPSAAVTVTVGSATFQFYTAQRSAFARDGHAAIAAFGKGERVVAKSPGPKNTTVTDTFSLRGFSASYAATNKACPPK
ncbi:MAG: hypothetical protein JOY70_06940 [Acidisphaera sp.]|nr:hypothetical protein [Acidisphaera sp.]